VNAPVRGLRFSRPADDVAALQTEKEAATAGAAVEKLQREHMLAQMRPTMHAQMGDAEDAPTTVQGALGKLASS
jgi:hypothetical protein